MRIHRENNPGVGPDLLLYQDKTTDENSMNSSVRQSWIPMDRISSLVQLETALILICLAIGVYFFYKLFLKEISRERHKNLQGLFLNLLFHFIFASFFYACFEILQ